MLYEAWPPDAVCVEAATTALLLNSLIGLGVSHIITLIDHFTGL